MALGAVHMTPELLETSYRLLLGTLPFRRWKLPHPDKIEFSVSLHRDRLAHHRAYCAPRLGEHEIVVSAREVKDLVTLTRCMAHEMVHIRQDILRMKDHHGAGFKKLAALVCRRHGFDVTTF
jgi:hypothetical protein